MICPMCGFLDKEKPTPNLTKRGQGRKLRDCPKCHTSVWAMPTTKTGEYSQLETVEKGEAREELLADLYVSHLGYEKHIKTDEIDIDRVVLDKGEKAFYLEIKERSNSINAYKITKFPYAKIETAKKLIKKNKIPVFIVLKFTDCWARIEVSINQIYKKGKKPFAPRYRAYQNFSTRQVPVHLDVEEDLEILNLRDLCLDEY